MTETCTGITIEKIRATVDIGGYEIKTPYVKSINVSKSRSQLASTFSLTVEVPATASFNTGEDIKIYAGVKDDEKRIFTGMIRQITVNPSFDKPGYYVVNMSGADILINLENKRFSRRIGGYGFSMFTTITGGPKNRPTMGFSIDKTIARGHHTYTARSPAPNSLWKNSPLIRMPERGKGKTGEREKIDPLGGAGGRGTGTGALGIHSHETILLGGPAYGTFSVS